MDTTRSVGRKEFKGIDVTKFVLALFVVAGHTHPFKDVDNLIFMQLWETSLLLVVPYFFMAAGFFLFSKVYRTDDKKYQLDTIRPYLFRIFKLYLYWTIIFLPITLWRYFTDDLIFQKDLVLFIRGTFFFGENYYSWPLWFLLSMTYSIAFIYLLTLINFKWKGVFIASVIIFIIAIIFNYLVKEESENSLLLAIGRAIKYLFLTGRLFTGMFYLMVGGLIALNKIKLSAWIVLLMIIVAVAFQLYEVEIVSPLLFSFLPITLFYLTINLKLESVKNNAFLRKCSTVLYFTHMIVFFLYSLIFRGMEYFGWDAFLVSVIVPILLTPLIIRNEERFPILKELFG
ncbi:acyltransferase family protein [Pedobacter xixiisoli]|uniref:Acyltransferase family protein n=1 Tax=Pedobacter xixiisoli TaxID=1476464 RepID=A0A286ADT0_9SPHI|nr:acyltransferase family protein [Pedobacter xixiisoli]SOD20058.1 Acyltransferase family protein [Pedobacter xixiisoli]